MRTWEPDTCGCRVEEIYQGNQPVGIGQIIRKCEAHTGVDDADLYEVILNVENRRKNAIANHVASGGIPGTDGATLGWSFSGTGSDRTLTVWLDGIEVSQQNRDDLRFWCDTQFGVGKVTVA